jgi:dTDP-4-amino-4,6-dideoxygalactose transaminase
MIRVNALERQNAPLLPEFFRVLNESVSTSSFILRDEVKKLEERVRYLLGEDSQVIGVNSGTDALMLSIFAAGIRAGDEVLVPSRTYIASVSAIVHARAKPVFIDVGEDLNLDVDCVVPLITSETKAIMPVHLSGHPCEMQKIMQIARDFNLVVIEDAAPAIGSKFRGQSVGSFGDFAAISLHPLKVLGVLGDGGLLVVNNHELANYLSVYRDHGHPQPKAFENFNSFGVNSRLDNIQAGFANIKIPLLDNWINQRRKNALRYLEVLVKTRVGRQFDKQLESLRPGSDFYDSYSSFVISVENRGDFIDSMASDPFPVEVLTSFPRPLHNHPNLLKFYNISLPQKLPRTEYFSERTVQIPVHADLTDREVEIICEKLSKYFRRKN